MKPIVIVWDLETAPDLAGFAAANDLVGKPDADIRAVLGNEFPKHIYHSIVCIGAIVESFAASGKPSFSFTEHGELRIDWPGCEGMTPAEQAFAILAAVHPDQVLSWLESEAMTALGQRKGGDDNVVIL